MSSKILLTGMLCALKAVENAAPFSPLPCGTADVDYQYTFDYDVSTGKGTGVFKKL